MSALFCFISDTAKVTREIKSLDFTSNHHGRCATEWSACGCYGFDPAWLPGYDFFSLVPNTSLLEEDARRSGLHAGAMGLIPLCYQATISFH